jgi:NhaP-type Na+/H+ or K+/H+ antiporter
MSPAIAIFTICIVLFAALANKLGHWSITMPMVFVAIGILLGPLGAGLLALSPQAETIKVFTEITLALLLFADASTLTFGQVVDDAGLTGRLLAIVLPLTMLLGAVAALLLLPGEGLTFACLLGAILAPTDAALGLPIFNNPRVPVRIRRALNIESGLNDGIVTPFVLLFLAFAVATEEHVQASGQWWRLALSEIVLALLAGAAVGLIGGWLLRQAARRGWSTSGSEQIAIIGLALAAYFTSVALGGNGFIAAFVGGIAFRATTSNQLVDQAEFTETSGTFLSLIVWSIFGAVMVPLLFDQAFYWRPLVYAMLSLTVVRMAPAALAMVGTGLRPDTVALMGWFGPRGLASVVFTLLALEEFQNAGRAVDTLMLAATWTILLSVMLHGLTAAPLSSWYARRLGAAQSPPAELAGMSDLHQRRAALTRSEQ